MRTDCIGDIKDILCEYFNTKVNIATVYLFGSFGTLSYNNFLSDIDLAILFFKKPSLKEEMQISAELSIILKKEDVDLTVLNELRVDICHEILCTGEIIYERERKTTADFVEKTLKYAFDYGFTLTKIKEDFYNNLKEEALSHDK